MSNISNPSEVTRKLRIECIELVARAKNRYEGVAELISDAKKIEEYITSDNNKKETE